MDIDAIFNQRKKRWNSLIKIRKSGMVEEIECKQCKSVKELKLVEENSWICPDCGYYHMMSPGARIKMISDEGTFKELYANLQTKDPLKFPEYMQKIRANQKKTESMDAVVTGTCEISGMKTAIAVLDGRFFMGSMGTVVGEKIVKLCEYAKKRRLPLVIYAASGGARMQEGLFSLMQMARTSAAIEQFKTSGGLFVSVLTNPTTGGVSASFASLGDIMIAEPNALICFAGPRVIEQTIGQKLPEGFQHAEFLLEHGMIDMIVPRNRQKKVLSQILRMHLKDGKLRKNG